MNTSHFGLDHTGSILALKRVVSAKVVVFIHDLIPIEYPQFVRSGHDEVHASRMRTVSAVADAVIVNSHATGRSLRAYFKAHELFCPRINTSHIGIEEHFLESVPVDRQAGSSAPYFVVLGTIEPRKNHLLLLKVWRDLLGTHGQAPQLIVIGKRGWNNQETFSWMDNLEELSPFVEERSDVSDRELVGILQNARALLMPSFSEGWGMPVVEALALGTPVVASNIGAHLEASGGAATLISPHEQDLWTRAIAAIWFGSSSQSGNGVAASFTPPLWPDHFRRLEELFSELDDGPSS